MGLEEGIMIASGAMKAGAGLSGARAQEDALRLRLSQERFAAEREMQHKDEQLRSVLGTQRAEGAARGIEPTSASLAAISEDTFQKFAEDRQADMLNLKFKENAINTQIADTHRTAMFKVFGNLFDAANRFNDLKKPDKTVSRETLSNKLDFTPGLNTQGLDLFHEGPEDLGIINRRQFNRDQLNDFIGF